MIATGPSASRLIREAEAALANAPRHRITVRTVRRRRGKTMVFRRCVGTYAFRWSRLQ